MRCFGTHGRVRPEQHYVVSRTAEIADFIDRVKSGKYIVLFAPRQTGKTTFFRLALEVLTEVDPTYFPIQLDFQMMKLDKPLHQKLLQRSINRQPVNPFSSIGVRRYSQRNCTSPKQRRLRQ